MGKSSRSDRPKRAEFKPDIRSANAIIGAVAFLQKTGFAATPRAIRACITQRCRKPAGKIFENMHMYLSRGLELGILKRFNGSYKLGEFEIKKRRKRQQGQKGMSKKKQVEVLKEAGNCGSGDHEGELDETSSPTSFCNTQ